MQQQSNEAQNRLCRLCIALAIVALAAAGVALSIWPALDMAASRAFYQPGWGFLLVSQPRYLVLSTVYQLVRPAFLGLTIACIPVMLAAAVLAARRRARVAGIGVRGWLFLVIALLLGPGLLVNAVLKETWGRARPDDTTLFGGLHQFSPALVPSDQCRHNCSFVAGDPSVGFYLQAFGYVRRRRQRAWLAAGLTVGGLLGLLRIGMGAHFLSDVLFSGVVVMLSTAVAHAALFGPRRHRPRRTGSGPGGRLQERPFAP